MRYYIVDAFTETIFKGNQAGVCIMDEWLEDDVLQNIAAENNLAETAFLMQREDDYDLRWFTPKTEVDLCGHATLASAFIISNFVNKSLMEMNFHTKSGILSVQKIGDLYELNFPARKPERIQITSLMEKAIGVYPQGAYLSRNMLLLLDNEQQVANISPEMGAIAKLPDCHGLIVTAKGDDVDFVSRFFHPNVGVPEDAVTGSSHTTLIPFWAEKLQKDIMVARQLSKRGGTLFCKNCGDRVKIAGKAALYLQGEIRTK